MQLERREKELRAKPLKRFIHPERSLVLAGRLRERRRKKRRRKSRLRQQRGHALAARLDFSRERKEALARPQPALFRELALLLRRAHGVVDLPQNRAVLAPLRWREHSISKAHSVGEPPECRRDQSPDIRQIASRNGVPLIFCAGSAAAPALTARKLQRTLAPVTEAAFARIELERKAARQLVRDVFNCRIVVRRNDDEAFGRNVGRNRHKFERLVRADIKGCLGIGLPDCG